MRWLVLVLVVAAAVVAGSAAPAARSAQPCGFTPVPMHRIDERRHISCAEAKAVLRELRGSRRTIPMICGRPRRIGGWWVENTGRLFSAVVNRYTKGRRSLHVPARAEREAPGVPPARRVG